MGTPISLVVTQQTLPQGILNLNYSMVSASSGSIIGYVKLISILAHSPDELAEIIEALEDAEKYSCSEFFRVTAEIPAHNLLNSSGLIFVDEIHINENYRGLGVGSEILSRLLREYTQKSVSIVLEACPGIDGSQYAAISNHDERLAEMKRDRERLKCWYAKFGFKPFNYSDYMLIAAS